ncbi:helix-hairpin-helix domain-containing protein [Jiulongibacter sediminis]|uniref:Competence protein ComEA n=1 Tax=Jiulongibacter sediminis TaxID=1605367 RepID=A0A0P7C4Y7_9BACT|nr:helix-hairpin-helix domain-containing protein [Jiulongibacter sediminis]KPM47069.1 hypothetical protein AFM12_17765 [Jiulongibacter sediminis]TBX22412.1 hypothetical protein TK44_17770 [Jiulongibacter sediminis]
MKSILNFIKRNFELSQNEAKSVLFGLLALVILFLVSITIENITTRKDRQFSFSAYYLPEKELANLNQEKAELIALKASEKKSVQFKAFDPNKISAQELINMGFPRYGANNLVKFRKAGKVYRFKEDVASVYGINEELFEKIEAFIELPSKEDQKTASTYETIFEGFPESEPKKEVFKPKTIEKFDINLAKTEELTQVYGIGKVFADRIVRYRESLGGFYDISQLKNTYGLPDSTYEELIKHVYLETAPIKIKINEVELSDWKAPHLSYSKKKGILAYRKQHGHFSHVDELKKLHILTPEEILAISPYLDFSKSHD